MTNFRKLTTATAILSASALMSGAAFADSHNMTCGDFNALDSDAQMEVAMNQGPDGGIDQRNEEARGEDGSDEGADIVSSTSADIEANDDAGQEGQRTMARGGDEVMAAMVEHCKGGDDLMVMDAYDKLDDKMGQ